MTTTQTEDIMSKIEDTYQFLLESYESACAHLDDVKEEHITPIDIHDHLCRFEAAQATAIAYNKVLTYFEETFNLTPKGGTKK